jgi:hypothetical protein
MSDLTFRRLSLPSCCLVFWGSFGGGTIQPGILATLLPDRLRLYGKDYVKVAMQKPGRLRCHHSSNENRAGLFLIIAKG